MPTRFPMHFSLRAGGAIALWLGLGGMTSADIHLPSPISVPPQAESRREHVLRGQQARIELRAHYSGGSSLYFTVVRQPVHGHLSAAHELGDDRASVLYTHDGKGRALDSFSYIAQAGGRSSTPAEVQIQVDEPAPRLQIPDALDFGEITTGESATRTLTIRNLGGGVLEGHLTVSNPWTIKPDGYRVESGTAEDVTLNFRPNESKKFVGQITLAEAGGRTASVAVMGNAVARATPAPTPVPTSAATPVERAQQATPPPSPVSLKPPPMPSPTAVARSNGDAPAPAADDAPTIPINSLVRVIARRTKSSQWELQWPLDQQHPEATYRVDERTLSLDKSGGLLTQWNPVAAKISATPNHIVGRLEALDDDKVHMLRVTAFAADGSALWEAPLVALQPRPARSHEHAILLLSLGILLAVFLFLRWRA